MKRKVLCFAVFLFLLSFFGCPASGKVAAIQLESHYAVPDGEVAEIVAASPDGMTLYYTNASGKNVGVLDITDPAAPVALGTLSTGAGEPTSAAVSGDGKYLFVAVRNGDTKDTAAPGSLLLYDISGRTSPKQLGDIAVGVGPDSLAIADQEGTMVVVIAIEDEETNEEGDATLGGTRPGRVDVVTVDRENVSNSKVVSVLFPSEVMMSVEGVNFPNDPQPEFVAIHPNQKEAVVSLQENNAIAFIDISDPAAPKIRRIACTGTVNRLADLKKDARVSFTDEFVGRREPDSVAYMEIDGTVYVAVANEGDTDLKTFGDGVWSGGRGISICDSDGVILWDSGLELDFFSASLGHYPDDRSEKRGLEMEGITFGRFFGDNLLIGTSERGSFLAVYRVQDVRNPELLELLPTGAAPEGIITVTERKDGVHLIVSANEKDGTICIFSVTGATSEPRIISRDIPWSALSGFTTDGEHIYTVPDNARKPSCIWRMDMSQVVEGIAIIDNEIPLVKDGQPVAYDLEGISWTKDGFWLVSEGKTGIENLLVFASPDGVVQAEYALPPEMIAKYGEPKNYGFEGVAVSGDGKTVYVAIQRGFDAGEPRAAILRFSTDTKQWDAAWYPLESHSKDPKKYWMGLSDIAFADENTLLVVERDKGAGGTAEVKRVYSIAVDSYAPERLLEKKLVFDIVKEKNYLLEKVESLCVLKGDMWIVNDNDGAGWSRMINLGPVR